MQILWLDHYLTGVERIDQEHIQLVRTLNEHFARSNPDMNLSTVFTMLADFNAYALTHFATEAQETHTAGLENSVLWQMHQGEHEYYQKRMQEFQGQAQGDCPGTAEHLRTFMHYWWLNHLCDADQKLGRAIMAMRHP